jgi:hypothetical protein
MAPEEAALRLAGSNRNVSEPRLGEQVARAQAAVAARQPTLDQRHTLAELPETLAAHAQQLRAQPLFAPLAAEGWTFKLADLGQVCALQATVFRDHARERTQAAAGDLLALASITLPMPEKQPLPVQYDAARNTWVISSLNPNLQILGHFKGPVQHHLGCGFLVGILPSFVQVALYRGRYVLIDGYHRSLGLLARGIRKVPVLFRAFGADEPLFTASAQPDFLPEAVMLGERPPLLPDYLDDRVAAEVWLPTTRKIIIIHGVEVSPHD